MKNRSTYVFLINLFKNSLALYNTTKKKEDQHKKHNPEIKGHSHKHEQQCESWGRHKKLTPTKLFGRLIENCVWPLKLLPKIPLNTIRVTTRTARIDQ